MNLSLFEFELKENNEPVDETRIQTVNLPFSQAERSRFNELCRKGMVDFYGADAKNRNAVDFLLDLLERTFGSQTDLFDETPTANPTEGSD